MDYRSLAVKYRPQEFEDVVEQGITTTILKRQLENKSFKNVILFSGHTGCVDDETEYFNGTEWKKISDYTPNESILVYDRNGTAFLEKPSRYIVDDCAKMYLFEPIYGVNMCLSEEHRIIYRYGRKDRSTNNELREIICEDYVNRARQSKSAGEHMSLIQSFNYTGNGIDLSDYEIRVMCMVMADGYFRSSTKHCTVALKKARKIERAKWLLDKAGIEYKIDLVKGTTRFYFYAPRREKEFTSYWYDCSQEQMEIVCDEVMYWDGEFKKRARFSSTSKASLDFVQFCFASNNRTANITYENRKARDKFAVLADGTRKTYHYAEKKDTPCGVQVTLKKDHNNLPRANSIKEVAPHNNKKYCFTTSTGMWVMRRHGRIVVTGNCGKTTLARLFAKKINNGVGDPIELDCASNNSVDNIRAIVESAYERSLVGEYKIFILDEVHMLSNSAWNALLKCIEETPKYTIFILCTTEKNKVLPTVLNRAQCFTIAPISAKSIYNRLCFISRNEGFTNYEKVCETISHNCNGSMRNAITYLEQVSDFSKELSMDAAKAVLNGISYEMFFRLTWAIIKKTPEDIFSVFDNLYASGQDIKTFINGYFNFIVDVVKFTLFKSVVCTDIPEYLAQKDNPVLQDTVNMVEDKKVFNRLADKLLKIKNVIKSENSCKNTVVMMLLEFIESEVK